MQRFFKTIQLVFIVFVVFSYYFGTAVAIHAQTIGLSDPDDVLRVYNPGANTVVRGTVEYRFSVYDDDHSSLDYSIKLFDAATCQNTNYGTIANGTVQSSLSNTNTVSWNTGATTSNSTILDGLYCVKICLVYGGPATPYSACNNRVVTIANTNQAPFITSAPANVQLQSGESFSYDVQANDADGDTLTYRLVAAPTELQINSSTGLITSNIFTVPAGLVYEYSVTVAVEDGLNAPVQQSFTFRVAGAVVQTTPTAPEEPEPTETPEPEEDPEEEPEAEPGQTGNEVANISVQFKKPTANSTFNKGKNIVQWDFEEDDAVANVLLEYSLDLENWETIDGNIDPTVQYYVWDSSDLEDGEYYLRIILEDEDGDQAQQTSPKFNVQTFGEGETESAESPALFELSPAPNAEIADITEISGSLLPSEGAEIAVDSFMLLLDGIDITATCTIDTASFTCPIEESLDSGKHVLSATVADSEGKTTTEEWTVTLQSTDLPEEEGEEGAVTGGGDSEINDDEESGLNLTLIITLIVVAAILLFTPWIIYALWKRRRSSNELVEQNQETYYENQFNPAANQYPNVDVTINQPQNPQGGYVQPTPTTPNEPIEEYNQNPIQPV